MGTRVYEYPLLIREQHIDSFGHVNNATYLQLFEEARWSWFTSAGYGYERIQKSRQGPTILECRLQFKSELRLRQQVLIISEALSYVGKLCQLKQLLLVEGDGADRGTISCEADFVLGLFDLDKRKLLPPSEPWLRAVDMLERYEAPRKRRK